MADEIVQQVTESPAEAPEAQKAETPAEPSNNEGPEQVKVKNIFEEKPETPPLPEKYEFNLAKGLSITEDMQKRLTDVAKSANLTQETMDALLKLHGEAMISTMNAATKQLNDWAEDCGKQGLLEPEKINMAKATVKMFGGDEAMKVLIETGAANHPAVLKMLETIGSFLTEDTPPAGKAGDEPKGKDINVLFPNSQY